MCLYNQKRVEPQAVAEEVFDWVLEFNKGNPSLRVKKKSIMSEISNISPKACL